MAKYSFERFGVMIDMSRNAVMNLDALKRYMTILKKMGYNMVMLYTEDTYELNDNPYFGYLRGRYSKEEMKEIAAIINLVLTGTKPGLTKEGKPAKGKIDLDPAVQAEAKKRVEALLSKFVLYPELDLDFLKKEFVK